MTAPAQLPERARAVGIGGRLAGVLLAAALLAGCSDAAHPPPAPTPGTRAAPMAPSPVPGLSSSSPSGTPAAASPAVPSASPAVPSASPSAPSPSVPSPSPQDCRGAKDVRTSRAQPFTVCGIIVVSKNHKVAKSYRPELTPVGVRLAVTPSASLTPDATAALRKLFAAAKTKGYTLAVRFGYRSYALQDQLYRPGATLTAPPGASEHQTGLAVDLAAVAKGKQIRGFAFGNAPVGAWVRDNAHTYGFILRYPPNGQKSTGYPYEPWHLRYVGVEQATKIKASGLTLEQYLRIA